MQICITQFQTFNFVTSTFVHKIGNKRQSESPRQTCVSELKSIVYDYDFRGIHVFGYLVERLVQKTFTTKTLC